MAYAPTGSLISQNSAQIEEILNRDIEAFLPALDVAWRRTMTSSMGVISADNLGRDLKLIKLYNSGLSGVIEMADSRSSFNLFGDHLGSDLGSQLQTQSIANTWPDATTGATTKVWRLGVGLKSVLTNLLLTMSESRAEATKAFVGQILAPKLEGHARMIAHQFCNWWYLSDNTYYKLTTISSKSAAFSTNTVVTFTPTEYAIDRLQVGMRVDIFDSTGATRRNESAGVRTPCFVTSVNEVSNTVKLTIVGQDVTSTVANTDIVVLANSKGYGIAGINSWMKFGGGSGDDATNCLLGADRDTSNVINVETYEMFRSWKKDHGGGSITEHSLRKYIASFNNAKRKYGMYIDTLIASNGVWLSYESTKIAREIIDRTNRLSSMKKEGSAEGNPVFEFEGRTYDLMTSSYIDKNVIYGQKWGGGNWKKIVAPSPEGVRKNERVEKFIPFEFVGPAIGHPDIKVPITRNAGVNGTSLVTEGMQLPGQVTMQLVPDQPCGMKITNVAEDRVFSD